jgi:membrane protease YdiL (CAAX protease family)
VHVRDATAPRGVARGLRQGVTPLTLVLLLMGIGATDWLVTQPFARPALLLKAVLAIGFVAYASIVLGLSSAELGLARRDARPGVLVGSIAAGGILVVIAMVVIIPASRGYFTSSRVRTDSPSLHWLEPLLIIPFGTVLFEELIFRGVLLGATLRRWGTRTAVAVTSIVFGLWHLPDALRTTSSGTSLHVAGAIIGTIAVTTAAGVLFALLRLRSKSLIAPILAHLAFDAGAYAAALTALKLWG